MTGCAKCQPQMQGNRVDIKIKSHTRTGTQNAKSIADVITLWEANVFCPLSGDRHVSAEVVDYHIRQGKLWHNAVVRKGHLGVVALVSRSARFLLYPRNLPIMLY